MAGEHNEVEGLNVAQSASEDEIRELGTPILDEGDSKVDKGVTDVDGGDDTDDDDLESEGRVIQSAEEQAAGSEADKARIREADKQKRLNQRQRQKAKIEQLERQLANALASNQNVNERVSQLENTNVGTQYATLQSHEQQAMTQEQQYKDIIADATVKGDGIRVAEATQALIEVRERKTLIQNAKTQLETQARQPRHQKLDQAVASNATAFMAKVPWYKGPQAVDQNSMILKAIDNAMSAEGWDPRSPTYWTELESRTREALPKLFQSAAGGENGSQGDPKGGNGAYNPATERRTPKSPVAGSGSNNSGGGSSQQSYRLSGERVKAMKEAGIWEDPKRRANMIKRYQELDKQTSTT